MIDNLNENSDPSTNQQGKDFNPQKKYVPKILSFIINWVESLIERYSIYGNLPVYDNSTFPWASEVDKEWKKIRAELDNVMKRREELLNFHKVMSELKTIDQDNLWKAYMIAGYGLESERNSKNCPETTRILKKIPGMKTAFFSILSPNKHIPPHKGPYNGVLRYHLGLIVPEPKEQCRIRIGNEIRHWEEGKSIIFDDTFNHQVWNNTSGYRAVLFVDFVRPLKFPINLLNKLFIRAARFTSALRKARENQMNWEKEFYKQ